MLRHSWWVFLAMLLVGFSLESFAQQLAEERVSSTSLSSRLCFGWFSTVAYGSLTIAVWLLLDHATSWLIVRFLSLWLAILFCWTSWFHLFLVVASSTASLPLLLLTFALQLYLLASSVSLSPVATYLLVVPWAWTLCLLGAQLSLF